MAIKMNLMLTNQIMMAFTLSGFEIRYPVNNDIIRQKVAKHLKIMYSLVHIISCAIYCMWVQCVHHPDCMVNRMCAVGTLKDLNISTSTTKKKLIWPQSHHPEILLISMLSLSFQKCLHMWLKWLHWSHICSLTVHIKTHLSSHQIQTQVTR